MKPIALITLVGTVLCQLAVAFVSNDRSAVLTRCSLFPLTLPSSSTSNENGLDEDYPWCFTGRFWFRPALVRVQDSNTQALDETGVVNILQIFGYTLGGNVVLEYDTSPVGPYREFVSMGALVACSNGGMVGQWGSRLYVNTKSAEDVCQKVWGVPAEVADIDFIELGSSLQVKSSPDPMKVFKSKPVIEIGGWSSTRVSKTDDPVRGGLPILWTPTIKALWAKLLPSGPLKSEGTLPVHKLRLSGSSIKLQWSGLTAPAGSNEIPLGLGISIDNVRIEIGRTEGYL